ncbi:MAG: tRNA pseudouridine(55) synthase TruB [Oscillospiraceae bacterium]|nr:tRNA pseudouridine(55) synthase TruB [Oscillospiraceae bacterium]
MVYFVRRMFGIKKVGHTGTLDPIATGVLPMLLGSATKLSDLLLNHDKVYSAVLKLGLTTDTMDITGKILKTCDIIPDYGEVREAAESFIGGIEQTPPIYSAVKINGRKLYEYARSGADTEEINIPSRKINIYSITCGKTDKSDEFILNISCSKGTYVRSICSDIGEKLKCGGVMASLCRIKSGRFDISESYTPEYLKDYADKSGNLSSLLISCEDILKGFANKKIVLDEFYSKLAKNGAEIYIKKLWDYPESDFNLGDKVLMYGFENICFALGEIKNYDDGIACKPQIFI